MVSRPQIDQASLAMTDRTSPATFLNLARAIDLLAAYGEGTAPLPVGLDLPSLTSDHLEYIATARGRTDVAVWASTFRDTRADILTIRATLDHHPETVTVTDVAAAVEVAERMFAGLATWLDSSPALAS